MLTCQLQGGLGNQCFQIAATISTALKNNVDYWIPNQTTPPNIKRFGKHFDFPDKRFEIKSYWNEKDFTYTPIEYTDWMCLVGYFQSYKYFEGYENEIRDALGFKEFDVDFVGVHVRRGDYLRYPEIHPVVTKEYIWTAMRKFYDLGLRKFRFFSDDIKWCKENFPGYEFSHGTPKEDMNVLMNCKHLIISNSTFSLFPALLSKAVIIAPKIWFGNGINTKDLLPDYVYRY